MNNGGNYYFSTENPVDREIADVIGEKLREFDPDAQCYTGTMIDGTTTDRCIQCEYRYGDMECHCTIRRQNDGKFKIGYALFGNGLNNTYERIDDNAEILAADVCSLVGRHYNEYHPNNQQNNNHGNIARLELGSVKNLFYTL